MINKTEDKDRRRETKDKNKKRQTDFKRKLCMRAKNILQGFNESKAHSISGAMTLVGL